MFGGVFDFLLPIRNVWWNAIGVPLTWALSSIYHFLAANPAIAAIGAYGVAIVLVTIMVRLLLSPLFQLQLMLSRRSIQQQKKLAPQMAELRKKYKNDPRRQQAEMMALYKEHGVNPLGSLSGCLPALVQFPILSAMYFVFLNNANHHAFADHFLFVPHLNDKPLSHALVPGLPIPVLAYLIIPVLAAATTFVQSRMMQQPLSPVPTEQEKQQQQMTRTMQVMMPLMIAYFAFLTPAGLGLYWFISNLVSITQQYFVTGWGGLRPQAALAGADGSSSASIPSRGASAQKAPPNGSDARQSGGQSPKPANRPAGQSNRSSNRPSNRSSRKPRRR